MNVINSISSGVFVLLIIGVLNRRRVRVHVPIMVSAITIDVGLVLYLELARGVIESIPGREKSPLLMFHILLSVTVLVLYGIQIVTGIKKARGKPNATHGKVMIWLLVIRFGNLITSFLVMRGS